MVANDDGAGRKVKRLDRLAEKVLQHGSAGISLPRLTAWAERSLGLSDVRVVTYLRILERTQEIEFDPVKRRYYHISYRLKEG